MTTQEWKDLLSMYEVAEAQVEKWEIEVHNPTDACWSKWEGTRWSATGVYRGRPKQPKNITVTSECWRWKTGGDLSWNAPGTERPSDGWQRFPAGDITGEVEE